MKKLIAILALVAFTVSVNAQSCPKGDGDKAKCPASKCDKCAKGEKCDKCTKGDKPADKKA